MRVAVTGGGTGGHVYPAIAVLDELSARLPDGLETLWIGTKRKEAEILPRYRIPLALVDIIPPRRSLAPSAILQNVKLSYDLLTGRSYGQALRHLAAFDPDCLIGTGGYVAYPACRAAPKLGIPLYLIEPNAVPGLVTRKVAAISRAVFCAHDETAAALGARARCEVVGAPVRGYAGTKTIERIIAGFGLEEGRTTILVMGGSSGASFVNEIVFAHLVPFVNANTDLARKVQILHQTVGRDFESASAAGATARFPYRALPYIEDSTEALYIADVFIGRSGASAVGEVVKFGVPAIFIPYAHHKDQQQIKNAAALAQAGIAYIYTEDLFLPEPFLADVIELVDASNNAALRKRIREMDTDAAGQIASLIIADLKERP